MQAQARKGADAPPVRRVTPRAYATSPLPFSPAYPSFGLWWSWWRVALMPGGFEAEAVIALAGRTITASLRYARRQSASAGLTTSSFVRLVALPCLAGRGVAPTVLGVDQRRRLLDGLRRPGRPPAKLPCWRPRPSSVRGAVLCSGRARQTIHHAGALSSWRAPEIEDNVCISWDLRYGGACASGVWKCQVEIKHHGVTHDNKGWRSLAVGGCDPAD